MPWRVAVAGFLAVVCGGAPLADDADAEEWVALFDGRSLDGWTAKVRGYPTGENHARTFRVENGVLKVDYDGYDAFDSRFGHLFYTQPFSHYRLRIEYRFVGEPANGTPDWAVRNSGVMLHSQPPQTMTPPQDFPISIEFQFLGGLGDGNPRPTGSVCTPGTHLVYRGQHDETHCIQSTSATYDGDQWVSVEALVLGHDRIVHLVDGEAVIEYGGPVIGGGVVSGHDPAAKRDGTPLAEGYIALQSEGHPIEFRRVELLNLKGCMDPQAGNYRRYHVEPQPDACVY